MPQLSHGSNCANNRLFYSGIAISKVEWCRRTKKASLTQKTKFLRRTAMKTGLRITASFDVCELPFILALNLHRRLTTQAGPATCASQKLRHS
jgi:hypothetical protein